MSRTRTTIGAMALGILVLGGLLPVADRLNAGAAEGDHALVGSWSLFAEDALGAPTGDPSVLTLHADGTAIVGTRAVRPAFPGMPYKLVYFSTGLGAWEPDGDDGAAFSVVHLRSDETGNHLGATTVSGVITVDEGGAVSSRETFTIGNPVGDIIRTLAFTADGERIAVEPLAEVGTPPAG